MHIWAIPLTCRALYVAIYSAFVLECKRICEVQQNMREGWKSLQGCWRDKAPPGSHSTDSTYQNEGKAGATESHWKPGRDMTVSCILS